MSRLFPVIAGVALVGVAIGIPLAYWQYNQAKLRNFHVVHEGVLYRSGQLPLAGLKQLINDYGIKTIVSLRDAYTPGEAPPDLAEEAYCLSQEINYCRIPPRTWWAADGSVPAAEGVKRFLEVMDDPKNFPVLVHCFAGIHRTGAYCAVYRMEYEHWYNADAIAEVKALGYANLDDECDIMGFLEQYHQRWRAPVESPVLHKAYYRGARVRKTHHRVKTPIASLHTEW
jgi:protein-tyrosine phosphatase